MNLHEYQSKQLLEQYGLPVLPQYVCETHGQAVAALEELGGNKWVAKCQVHTGGRGKAGGVKLVDSVASLQAFIQQWLGQKLKTYQSPDGQLVGKVLVEPCCTYKQELYLGAVIDRSVQSVTVIASSEGGVEIEKVAAETPEKIHKVTLDPIVGPSAYQGRQLAFKLGLKGQLIKEFTNIFLNFSKMFLQLDLSLVEINPLVITEDDRLLCLDAKISVDDNALYRHRDLKRMRDFTQEDPREVTASTWNLNYVALDGTIGCMVNGAGLAMGTMDLINYYGGKPANFLDVGGGATEERVTEAFKLILSDDQIEAVLVNIFGGIVRCDTIAEGIISAVHAVGVEVPVVVRLEGNNAKLGAKMLQDSGLNIITATSLVEAAEKVVACVEAK